MGISQSQFPLNYSRTAEDGTTVQKELCAGVQMVAELPMRRSMTAAPAMRPSTSSPSPKKGNSAPYGRFRCNHHSQCNTW